MRSSQPQDQGTHTPESVAAVLEKIFMEKSCTDDKTVRADRCLSTDDEAIRAQTTISDKTISPMLRQALC